MAKIANGRNWPTCVLVATALRVSEYKIFDGRQTSVGNLIGQILVGILSLIHRPEDFRDAALLVERVDIGTQGLNVRLRVDGLGGLAREMLAGGMECAA